MFDRIVFAACCWRKVCFVHSRQLWLYTHDTLPGSIATADADDNAAVAVDAALAEKLLALLVLKLLLLLLLLTLLVLSLLLLLRSRCCCCCIIQTVPLEEMVPRSASAGTCHVHVYIAITYTDNGDKGFRQ